MHARAEFRPDSYDNRIALRGRKMAHVSKICNRKEQKFVCGHIALVA